MDIHQAAKALVQHIDETGELPRLGSSGLCWFFSEYGVPGAFSAMDKLRSPLNVHDRRYDGYTNGLGPKGEWNDTRMTFLALLAETCAEDFESGLLADLRDLRKYGPRNENYGICTNADKTHGYKHKLRDLFKTWPEYSGNPEYPVPWNGEAPCGAYVSMGLWVGDYGDARKRLLDHCIAELEKESAIE